MMAAIVEGCISQAFCMAMARAYTSLRPSSNDRAPAATRAENSPNECPAVISGWKASPRQSAEMTECRNTAGCVTLVWRRSSSVPLNIISVMRYPKISFAFSNSSFASGELSYRSLPIPTNCAPWPGNTNAFINLCFKFKLYRKVNDLF